MSEARVTASGARSSPARGEPPQPGEVRRPWAVYAVIIAATVIALGLRLYDLSRPGYLLGVSEYDDGTDFGSAVRLVHGAVPYRDFVMVQPPGITLIMFPVALATKALGTDVGMAAGRVITVLASAAAVPLAGLLTRHRGLFATLVTCGVLAIYPDSILAARTVLLEPWLVLFCLLGALATFDRDRITDGRRRIFLGGLLFGFAGAVKVWAILPVAVILVLTARRPRQAAGYAAGVVLGFCVACPAVRAHRAHDLLPQRGHRPAGPQRHRPHPAGVPAPADIRADPHTSQLATPVLVIIGIVLAVLIAAVTVLGSRLAHSPPPALDWFAIGTCALVVAAFLWPADFYYHYAGFLAPFLALVSRSRPSRLLGALPSGGSRRWLALARPGGHDRDRARLW